MWSSRAACAELSSCMAWTIGSVQTITSAQLRFAGAELADLLERTRTNVVMKRKPEHV